MANVDVAVLGIKIVDTDVTKATANLTAMTVASDKAERSTERLESGLTELTHVARDMGTNVASVNRLLTDMIAREEQAARAAAQAAEAARKQAAAANAATAARRAQMELGQQMADAIERERRMTLLHAEALEINARATTAVGKAATGAHGGIGNLRQELVTMTRNVLNLNPAVAQTGALLGNMALGAGPMIAILGGVAALGLAWEKLTENARKAREEHERLLKVLDDVAKKQQLGIIGELGVAVTAAGQDAARLYGEIARLKAEADRIRAAGGLVLAGGIPRQIADKQAEYDKALALVRAGEAEISRILLEEQRKRADEAKHAADERLRENEKTYRALAEQYQQWADQLGIDRIAGAIPGITVTPSRQTLANLGVQFAAPNLMEGPRVAAIVPLRENVEKVTRELREQVQLATQLGSAFGDLGGKVGAFVGGLALLRDAQKRYDAGTGSGIDVFAAALPVAGGVVSLIQGIRSLQKASTEANLRVIELARSLDATRQSIADAVSPPSPLEQFSRQMIAARQEIEKAFPVENVPASVRGAHEDERARRLAELAKLEEQRNAQLREEERLLHRMFVGGLGVRNLRAAGFGDQADELEIALRNQQEYADAVKQFGENSAEAMSVLATQAAEAEARVRELALALERDLSDKIRNRYTSITGIALSESINIPEGMLNRGLYETALKQLDALEASKAQYEAGQRAQELEQRAQTLLLQDQLQVARDALRQQEQQVEDTRRTYEALKSYRDSLMLSNLSPLSARARLTEATNQYNAIKALAAGGDASALSSLPGTANTYLEALRGVYASSAPYAQGFSEVQSFVASLTDKYGRQLSTEEKILAELQKQTDIADEQLQTQQESSAIEWVKAVVQSAFARGTGYQGFADTIHARFPNLALDSMGNFLNMDFSTGIAAIAKSYAGMAVEDFQTANLPPYIASRTPEIIDYLTQNVWGGRVLHRDRSTGFTGGLYYLTPDGRMLPYYESDYADLGIPQFAAGGLFGGGIMSVGERGPELVASGPARVHTSEQLTAPVVEALQIGFAQLDSRLRNVENALQANADMFRQAVT